MGLAPAPVAPHAFALDGGRLAYAGFRREHGGFALREARSLPLPEGLFQNGPLGGPLPEPRALAAAVEGFVSRLASVPKHASLVLPDSWVRATILELGALPTRADLRLDVLRFRLKRLVPFRVEELRVRATPIAPIAGQEDPIRAFVLFASEPLCVALEAAFAEAGVELGQITNPTLARLEALTFRDRLAGLTALATVEGATGFALLFARDGEPLLWRQKTLGEEPEGGDRAAHLLAEMRLTRTFLAERFGGEEPAAVLLTAPGTSTAAWTQILEEAFERPVIALTESHLPLVGEAPALEAGELALLLGAVCREVA